MTAKHEQMRQQILDLVGAYYHAVHEPEKGRFVPGETRVTYAARVFDDREMRNLVDSALEFWLTAGRYAKQLERRLAEFLGLPTVLLVNSGSSANLLAFMALTSPKLGDRRIQRGDEVITVAAGFPTTVAPIVQYGAVPVFVDVSLDTANVDVAALESAITSKTRAVMLAHTLGNPFDIDGVTSLCERHGLWLIEDNCDALGSTYKGRYTGTFGDVGTSSFYPPHHMTLGEGGAVYTGNRELGRIMLSMRDWGRDCWCESGKDNSCANRFSGQHGTLPFGYDHKYVYSHFGYNFKLTDLQAAVGCAQLDKLPDFIESRKRNFRILSEGLSEARDRLLLPSATPNSDPSWFGFLITLRDELGFGRTDLVKHLEAANIQTRNLFAGNIIRHPCCSHLREGIDYRMCGALANTDRIMNDSFWIGLYPGMTDSMLNYMIEKILDFIHQPDLHGA